MKASDFNGVSVLIVDGYARQTLCMSKGLKKLGAKVSVICFSRLDVGYSSKYPDKKILHKCGVEDYSEQETFVIDEIKSGRYDVVIPMTDYSATYLSKRKTELLPFAKIAVNDWEKFNMVIDKLNTMRICTENHIPSPKTLFTADPIHEMDEGILDYPIVVKPRTAAGSIGFNIVKSREELVDLLNNNTDLNGPLLVQEYVKQEGPQYGAEVFRDSSGNIKACLVAKIPRWFPLDGGSRVLSVTIHDEKIRRACIDLVNVIDWNGYANIDLVYDADKNEPRILEINPRTGASIKIDFISGVDLARLILENELGYEVTDMMDYPDDKQVSCFLVDLLWFIKSKDRFKAEPSWFARRKIKDIVFSIDDPIPFFAFCTQSALRYRHAMNRRKRKK